MCNTPTPPAPSAQFPSAPGLPGIGQAAPLATIGRRFAARAIDAALAGLLILLVGAVVVGILASMGIEPWNWPWWGILLAVVVGFFVISTVGTLYEILFLAMKKETPGKRILGLHAVTQRDRQPLSTWDNALRWLIPNLAGPLLCGFGSIVVYAPALFDRERRGLHDKAAKSVVVYHKTKA